MKPALIALLVLCACEPAVAAEQCSPVCDLNDDGLSVTVADWAVIVGAFNSKKGSPQYREEADLNGNGAIDANDWGLMMKFCPLK